MTDLFDLKPGKNELISKCKKCGEFTIHTKIKVYEYIVCPFVNAPLGKVECNICNTRKIEAC